MLLTPKETAEKLKVQPGTLARWRSLGEGPPYIKLKGGVRYSVDDLVRYMANSRRDPEEESDDGSPES